MKASYVTISAALLSLVTAAAPINAAEPKPPAPQRSGEREPGAKTSATSKHGGNEFGPGPATRPGGGGVNAVGSRMLLSEIQLIFDDRALAKYGISGDAAADAVSDLLGRLLKRRGRMFLLEDFEGATVTVDGKTVAVRDLGKVRVSFFREEPVPNAEEVEDLKLWTCPNHPRIVMEKSSVCPICRTKLERLIIKPIEPFQRLGSPAQEADSPEANPPSPAREPQP